MFGKQRFFVSQKQKKSAFPKSHAQAVHTCAQTREHSHAQQEKARPVSLLNLLWTLDLETIYRTGVSEVDVSIIDER